MEVNIGFSDSVDMDYEIINEEWNVYNLADGTILRIRPIITKILKAKQKTQNGQTAFGFGSSNVISVKVQDELKNSPGSGEWKVDDPAENIDFEVVKEPWNSFLIEDGSTLRVKLIVSRVKRTFKYNIFGEPIYIATSTNVMDVQQPEEPSSSK